MRIFKIGRATRITISRIPDKFTASTKKHTNINIEALKLHIYGNSREVIFIIIKK